MVLLYIYLGTIILTISINKLHNKYIEKEIENRGYEINNKKKNVYKDIINAIAGFLFCCIPIFNIAAAGYICFSAEKLCEECIQEAKNNGDIVKKTEKPKVMEEFEFNNGMIQGSKIVVYKVDNEQKKEMTREEKIEFLKQEYSRLTDKNLVKEEKRKAKQKRR